MKQNETILQRYKHLREAGANLNTELIKLFDKSDWEGAAKDLGLLQRGTMVFGGEGEMDVWMFCVSMRSTAIVLERRVQSSGIANSTSRRLGPKLRIFWIRWKSLCIPFF
jgi:hypothetical protein